MEYSSEKYMSALVGAGFRRISEIVCEHGDTVVQVDTRGIYVFRRYGDELRALATSDDHPMFLNYPYNGLPADFITECLAGNPDYPDPQFENYATERALKSL